MKYFLLAAFLFGFIFSKAQYVNPKLELHITPGLFSEQLSNDALIPPNRTNDNRIGDVVSYAVQYAMPLKNQRFTIKAGIGFSQRHYSLNKYSFGDFLFGLFLFDSPYRGDTFNLSYVRFTNNYFQIPVSGSYTLTRPRHNFQLAVGLALSSNFLTSKKVKIIFDSTYKIPEQSDIDMANESYTHNTSTFVFTAQPYVEGSFSVYKKLGLLFQFGLPSYYSSSLDKRLTTSTVDIFSFTFGAFYSLK